MQPRQLIAGTSSINKRLVDNAPETKQKKDVTDKNTVGIDICAVTSELEKRKS